jgi:hypothetical protein
MGITPDNNSLSKSYRCSPTVCQFITDNLGINIESHRKCATVIELIKDKLRATEIFNDTSIIKLFYKEHYKFKCFSRNWGDSKGEDKYFDVCIVLNKTTMDCFQKGKLNELKPSTKNKLYVALSRTKNNLYLFPDTLLS